jgi:hypothetical protein
MSMCWFSVSAFYGKYAIGRDFLTKIDAADDFSSNYKLRQCRVATFRSCRFFNRNQRGRSGAANVSKSLCVSDRVNALSVRYKYGGQ